MTLYKFILLLIANLSSEIYLVCEDESLGEMLPKDMCYQGQHLGLWHEAESSLDVNLSSPNKIKRLGEMHLEVRRRSGKHRAQILG